MTKPINQMKAKYIESENVFRSGNPNTAALPELLGIDEWMEKLSSFPEYKPEFRNGSKTLREDLCEEIKKLYIPVTKAVNLAVDFDKLLRNSYRERNPFSAAYIKQTLDKLDQWDSDEERMKAFDNAGINTSGIHVVGLSGIGKTRTIGRILSRYPQVIIHSEYCGTPYLVKQLVYLKIECPANGRVVALAEAALKKMDELLQTNYYEKYAAVSKEFPGDKAGRFISGFIHCATIHHLGVLIIDESQNLHGAKEGRVLLNTLVKMSNEFNIAIILIGTPKAEHILTQEFRQLRRGNGYGDYGHWDQMKNNNPKNLDWDNFIEKLWEYQFTSEVPKLTQKIKDVIYKYSGGISDLTIKFYISAQIHAIRNDTQLSVGVLNHVGEEEFAWAKKATQALQLGTQQALLQYEDLYFHNVKQEKKGNTLDLNPPFPQKTDQTDQVESVKNNSTKPPKKTSTGKKNKNKKGSGAGFLAETVLKGRDENQTAYKTLKSEGLIASLNEFLD